MSSSSMSAPAFSAERNAYIVLDGNSSSPPWWAMFSGRDSSHGLVAAPAAGAPPAAAPSVSSDRDRTARRARDIARQSVTWSGRSPRGPARSGDGVLDGAERLDLDADAVARGQAPRRVHRLSDAGRRPGEDDVAGLQGAGLREERDDLGDAEDQVRRGRVLAQLAVDPRAQPQRLRVGDLVGGGDPRAPRAGVVKALGPRPLRLALLQMPGGEVVGDRVARDRAAGPDHHDELALVVEAVGRGGGDRDVAAGRGRAG